MKFVYCSNCGKVLPVFRKALPKFATIIDMVEPHECSEEPVEINLKPTQVPSFNLDTKKGKFVQVLNNLSPSVVGKAGGIDSNDLKDRRFEQDEPKTTAPSGLVNIIKDLDTSIPAASSEVEPEE